ncbi:hypothetical protein SAMN06298226_0138 [Nitrosovibrio sp. Nv4]|nr:hypothetical protein SAMN06298226_0138 [Nitrosovibrio sp. Nv4]
MPQPSLTIRRYLLAPCCFDLGLIDKKMDYVPGAFLLLFTLDYILVKSLHDVVIGYAAESCARDEKRQNRGAIVNRDKGKLAFEKEKGS